jgi:hypothetical protein
MTGIQETAIREQGSEVLLIVAIWDTTRVMSAEKEAEFGYK